MQSEPDNLMSQLEAIRAEGELLTEAVKQRCVDQVNAIWAEAAKEVETITASQMEKLDALGVLIDAQAKLILPNERR